MSLESETPDWATLEAYFSERCSPTERESIVAWEESTPERAAMLAGYRRIWEGRQEQLRQRAGRVRDSRRLAEAVGESLRRNATSTAVATGRRQQVRQLGRQSFRLGNGTLRWSVVSLIGALAGIIGFMGWGAVAPSMHQRTYTTHTYHTTAAHHAVVMLPNGVRATLAPATTLTITTNRQDNGIVATLTGAVLFTVAHHQRSPFTVRAGLVSARVLGTTFLVRCYLDDRATRIAVAEGRVAVRSQSQETILLAQMRALVADSGPIQVIRNASIRDDTAWTTGQLVFHDTPARDVLAELSHTYDVQLRLADSALREHPITWTIPVVHQSLDEVLDGLTILLDAHVMRAGQIITLVPGRSSSRRPQPSRTTLTLEPHYGR